MKYLIVLLLTVGLIACSSTSNTQLEDAEWSCSNTQLAEYEKRTREEYLKVRCKE